MTQRKAWLWEPRHAWRGVRVDRSQLWPIVTIGWWTVQVLPGRVAAKLIAVLAEIAKAPAPAALPRDAEDPSHDL